MKNIKDMKEVRRVHTVILSLDLDIQGVFYDFTTLILNYSKSLTTFFTNFSGILEDLVCLQENLTRFDGEA